MYLGLDPDTALSCFHYDSFGEQVVSAGSWQRQLNQGDCFFLSAAAAGKCRIHSSNMVLVCCQGGDEA